MTIVEMLEQSGVLTLLGIGIVFSFLIILIICVTLAGKLFQALGGAKDLQPPVKTPPAGAGNGAVTAAISAAVNEYGKSHS
jgi:oxaloacetate decarboxylase gamma subunit